MKSYDFVCNTIKGIYLNVQKFAKKMEQFVNYYVYLQTWLNISSQNPNQNVNQH